MTSYNHEIDWRRAEWEAKVQLAREARLLDATQTRNGSPRAPQYDVSSPDLSKVMFRPIKTEPTGGRAERKPRKPRAPRARTGKPRNEGDQGG